MEDKEFIAQMAQFSSLEQMTSMSSSFTKLVDMFGGQEALSAIGKNVDIRDGERTIQGTVKAVTRGTNPEVLVNGSYYAWNDVTKVYES
jgi:flagellar basal-body rod modification protein FlgD